MRYVKGSELSSSVRAAVLRAYVHRGTHENATQTYGGRCPLCVQSEGPAGVVVTGTRRAPKVYTRAEWHAYHAPLVSDREWLAAHSFAVTKAGRLDTRGRSAMPDLMAEPT